MQATARKVAAAAAVEKNAVDAKNGASQIAVAKATAAKAATDLANAAQAAVGKANAAKSAAENSLVQQTAAAKTAQTKAAQAKAALDKATAAKIAAEKVVAGKATALVAANARVTAAAAAANQATAELAAANKRVVEQNASRDKIADQPFRNLAYAHDYGGREDPLLVFTAPRDGQYIVEVRDELYRGRAEFNYRLTIGQLPFVTSAFPAGGKRGATIPVKLRGINLTKTEFALDFAADTPVGGPRWRRAADTANDLAFAVGEDPEVIEVEPNDGAEQATATQVPATANGVIEQPGDVDYFKFNAAKGQRLFFETVSRSLGSPLDARLDLFDANGRRLKNNDDANSSPDSSIDHTFAADGEYTIRVGDTTGQGSSRHVYRLDVHPPRPDFALTVSPDNPRVTAGGATPLKVLVQRRQGFTGPIELTVANPPPGAIVSPTVMASNQTEQTVSITMPPDAAPGVVAISVVGKAKIGEQEVTRKARPSEQIRYVNAWRYVPVDDLLLTVMPQAPVVLMWAAPELKVTSGKTVEIPIKIQRTAGFTAPIRVVLQGLPSRVAAPPVTVAENASEAIVEIRTYNGAPVNLANVVANGSVSFQGRSYVQSSPALRLRVEAVKKEEPAKKK